MTQLQPALFSSDGKPKSDTPDWLLAKLDAEGHIDLASGASRRARPAKCNKCSAWVVRGLDADMCALSVDADPTPLSQAGEAMAHLSGRATFELSITGGRPEINRRHRWRIAEHPAGTGATDVLAQHVCGAAALPQAASRLPTPHMAAELPDEPPF